MCVNYESAKSSVKYPLELEKGDPIKMRGGAALLHLKERKVDRGNCDLTVI